MLKKTNPIPFYCGSPLSNTKGYSYSYFPLQIQLLQLNSCSVDVPPGLKHRGFTFHTKLFLMQFKLFHDILQLK